MKMKEIFCCKYCNKKFESEHSCKKHEEIDHVHVATISSERWISESESYNNLFEIQESTGLPPIINVELDDGTKVAYELKTDTKKKTIGSNINPIIANENIEGTFAVNDIDMYDRIMERLTEKLNEIHDEIFKEGDCD